MTASLFDTLKVGDITVPNRLVMAPLTRMRSKQPGNVPWSLNAQYYAQRAGAGLIVAEATQISQAGQGYPATPGIHSPEQVAGWQLVTDAVHQAGGRIFLQLWHVGRISHSSFQPDGQPPFAPSAIAAEGLTMTADWGQVPYETPRAMTQADIVSLLADYKKAAQNAKEAGFDGVEVHAANGYLLDQFLQDGTNKRTDSYGGRIPNRARLLLEVVDTVTTVWGAGRVGVRLSPYGTFNSMSDSDPVALFTHVLTELNNRGIAYAHVIEPRSSNAGGGDTVNDGVPRTAPLFRKVFKGVLISAGGHTPESAKADVADGAADMVAFGRYFISNPDLPERIRSGVALTAYDRATFYGGTEKGYTDYPTMGQQAKSA
jgi:N-ethylmaleimide reductase